jgi:hypothetical protein
MKTFLFNKKRKKNGERSRRSPLRFLNANAL